MAIAVFSQKYVAVILRATGALPETNERPSEIIRMFFISRRYRTMPFRLDLSWMPRSPLPLAGTWVIGMMAEQQYHVGCRLFSLPKKVTTTCSDWIRGTSYMSSLRNVSFDWLCASHQA